MSYYQKTLAKTVECSGIGLHSGRLVSLRLLPAPVDNGIVFRRMDLDGKEVSAKPSHVGEVDFATTLHFEGVAVHTVEHLMAALRCMGVDNAFIELNAEEVPIMDGSASAFVFLLKEAGTLQQSRPRSVLRALAPVVVQEEDRVAEFLPGDECRVTCSIEFNHPCIQEQTLTLRLDEASFMTQVAPARTFGFLEEVEALRKQGLARGGSLDNAVVLSPGSHLNDHLRYINEFVRHKMLDLIGDMALLGRPLRGHLRVRKCGHRLHTRLARAVEQAIGQDVISEPPQESEYLAAVAS